MQSLRENMEWFIKNLTPANSTNAQHVVFCYAICDESPTEKAKRVPNDPMA
jgi:hypothetical protein